MLVFLDPNFLHSFPFFCNRHILFIDVIVTSKNAQILGPKKIQYHF